jgi:hypothetical protein
MRKILLASAAMLGAATGIVSPAFAQSSSTQQPAVAGPQALQGQVAAPWWAGASYNNQNNSLAQISTYQGNVVGLGFDSAPLPGTVVIHLHGRLEFDADASFSNGNNLPGGTSTSGQAVIATTPAAVATTITPAAGATPVVASGKVTVTPAGTPIAQGAKLNPVSFGSYMRLYPGVDGMATNGLRYGGQMEIRENFSSTGSDPYPSAASASVGTQKSAETLFVNRAYIYISADNIGMVRVGQADGVIGLFDPCIFSGACWDAGVGGFQAIAGSLGPATNTGLAGSYFTLAQNSADYANTKAVYLSPQIFGFELGLQYAPNMGNSLGTCATNQAVLTAATAAVGTASGCVNATTGNEPTRWYNQAGVGLRYQGVFGPVSVGAYGFYEHAAVEHFFGTAPAVGKDLAGTFDPLNWYEFAAYGKLATAVGTFTASADYVGGAISSGTLTPRPTGGVSESGLQTGVMYQNGPITLGATGFFLTSQGSATLVGISQRQEDGLALGGNYNVAPGLFLVAEYQYTFRHQGGFNFISNANGVTTDAKSNTYFFGVVMNW